MKTTNKKLISLLLCAVVALGMLVTAFADDMPDGENVQYHSIQSVAPVDDAPYAKVRLTATGYEFTDWHVPTDYKLTLVDGSSLTVSAKVIGNIGAWEPDIKTYPLIVGSDLKAENNGEVYYLYATLNYQEDLGFCQFRVGELAMTELDETGSVFFVPVSTLLIERCETEVDKGSVFTRIAYWFYGILSKINAWMEDTFHRGFLL